MKEILIIVAPIAVALLIIAVLVTWLILKSRYGKTVNAVENKLIAAQGEVKSLSALRENDLASHERSVALLKEAHDAALKQQIAAIRAEMTAETERLLKQREEELSRKAEETFKDAVRECIDTYSANGLFIFNHWLFGDPDNELFNQRNRWMTEVVEDYGLTKYGHH